MKNRRDLSCYYEHFANFCANILTIELQPVILKLNKYKCGAGVSWRVLLMYPECDGPGSLLTEQGDPVGDDGFD